MRLWVAFTAAMLASASAFAWQLASKTLAERVGDADVIVVGRVGAIHSRVRSPIAGVGEVWSVSLEVSRTLKGNFPRDARVSFADVAVQDWPAFDPLQPRVWLLKTSSDPRLLTAPAGYESVLLAEEETRIRSLRPPPAASGAAARP